MVFSSGLMQGEWEVKQGDSNSDLLLHVSRNNLAVQDVFTGMSGGMAQLVDQFYTVGANVNNAGTQFVSNATSATYVPDRRDAAAILEGAAQMAVAGAAPYLTYNVIGKVSGLIVDHNDFANTARPACGGEPGQWGVWLSPFHSMSDVESNAFTLGLTGKYRFAADENLNIAPHLGLRYSKISLDDAEVKLAGGGKVFDTAVDDQNIFQIPLGVAFSGDIAAGGGWTVTPKADLGVLFSLGDTDADTRARIADTNIRSGVMNARVVDGAAFTGSLGVAAAADNGLSLSLDYGILASGNQTDHRFGCMLRFDF